MKSIKQFLKDETAVSFGYIVLAVFLLGGTAIWIEFAPVFNQLFTHYNLDISSGTITAQNQRAMNFHQNIISIAPIIFLLGLAGWGIIRALENRNQP